VRLITFRSNFRRILWVFFYQSGILEIALNPCQVSKDLGIKVDSHDFEKNHKGDTTKNKLKNT
jgi:hypothetical protein